MRYPNPSTARTCGFLPAEHSASERADRGAPSHARSTAVALAVAALLAGCTNGGSGGGESATPADPTFSVQVLLSQRALLQGPSIADAVVADLDGDGVRELVEISATAGALTVGVGLPGDEFVRTQSIAVGGTPMALAAGDLDGNGLAEVALLSLEGVEPDGRSPLERLGDPPQSFGGAQLRLATYRWDGDVQVAGGGTPESTDDVFGGLVPLGEDFVLPGYALTLSTGNLGHVADSLLLPSPADRSVYVLRFDGVGLELVADLPAPGPEDLNAPISALVYDVDGDGLGDVLSGDVAYDGVAAGALGVHLQAPDGSFLPVAYDETLPQPQVPLLSLAGDFDGDGTDDVAAVDLSTAGNAVDFLGRAGGGLEALGQVVATGRVSAIAVGDLDTGDGVRDVLIGLLEVGALEHQVLDPGLPLGEMEVTYIELGPAPRSIELTGADSSLTPALYCTHALGTSLLFREDTPGVEAGALGLRAARGYAAGQDSQFFRAADLDGDGRTDVVTVDQFQRSILFFKGQADGSLSFVGDVGLEPIEGQTPGSLILEDLDGDGDVDLALAVFEAGQVQVLRNGGALPFAPAPPVDVIDVGDRPLGIGAGDLNGDGVLDLAVSLVGGRAVAVLTGGQDPFSSGPKIIFTLAGTYPIDGERPLALEVSDLDGDGALDVAVSTGELDGSGTGAAVLRGAGDGSLSPVASVPLPFLATELRAADLDGSGALELLANQANRAATAIQILSSDGELADYAALPVDISSPVQSISEPTSISVADGDSDGDLDLLVLTGAGRPVALENLGGLDFVQSPLLPGSPNQLSIPAGVRGAQVVLPGGFDAQGTTLAELYMIAPEGSTLWVARGAVIPSGTP